MTFKRILVGLDEGELALPAVEAAEVIARAFGGDVEYLHAVPGFWGWTTVSGSSGERLAAALMESAHDSRLAFLGEKLAGEYTSDQLDERLVIVLERAGDALVTRAETPGADLIVLGPHDEEGLWDFGGTARSVLTDSPCPVWVQRGAVAPVRRVLAPISNEDDNAHTLALTRSLAEAFGAGVTVLHSFQPPDFAYPTPAHDPGSHGDYVIDDLRASERDAFERSVDALDWGDLEVTTRFEEGRPADRILDQDGVDLICMGTHTGSRLSKAVLGSEAYAVLKKATVPVVVCPLPS